MKKMLVIAAMVVAAVVAHAEKRMVVTLYSTMEVNEEQIADSIVYVEQADGSWVLYRSEIDENGKPSMVADTETKADNPLEHVAEWQKGSNYGYTEMKVVWKEELETNCGKQDKSAK